MTLRIGDSVFSSAGRPGVVVSATDDGTRVEIERQGQHIDETKKRGYINGLAPEDRAKFNAIVDEMRQTGEPQQKLALIGAKIGELKNDPRQFMLVRYLEAELAHQMSIHGIQPRVYTADRTHIG